MPFDREPIFHDRQQIVIVEPITTTSTTFVDIPGATLTTKDLSQTGVYQAFGSISIQQSNNNASISIRTVVDGVPRPERTINFGPNAANIPLPISIMAQAEGVVEGIIIKLQWKVSTGTAQINTLVSMFDGIPESRIIP